MNLKEYLVEKLSASQEKKLVDKVEKLEKDTEDAKEKAEDAKKEAEESKEKAEDAKKEADKDESITDEKSFREAAKAKFEEVFGDELDEDKMKDIVDGILDKYKKEAEAGDWGTLIGVLNKSFGK